MATSFEQIDATVEQIDYQFDDFAIEDFADWVGTQLGKPIVLQSWETMPSGVFGLWLSSEEKEYIYYNNKMPSMLKLVTLLHELSHIYLNHRTLAATDVLEALLARIHGRETKVKVMTRAIFSRESREEQEAEYMAILLLECVFRHRQSSSASTSPGTDYLKILRVS